MSSSHQALGDGTTVNAQVTVAASAATVYASDTFTRTSVNTWGSATTGGAYTLSGTVADYDVTGSVGTIALTAAGANRSAILGGVSQADADLSFRVRTDKAPTGSNEFIYGIVRCISSTTEYRAKLRLATNGNVYVQASSLVAGTETALGTEVLVPGLTYAPNTFIWLRTQVSGTNPTTIRIRAWADGGTEPTTWQYTTTNSAATLQAPTSWLPSAVYVPSLC